MGAKTARPGGFQRLGMHGPVGAVEHDIGDPLGPEPRFEPAPPARGVAGIERVAVEAAPEKPVAGIEADPERSVSEFRQPAGETRKERPVGTLKEEERPRHLHAHARFRPVPGPSHAHLMHATVAKIQHAASRLAKIRRAA